ncbi:MAG TPA: alpha/beta hydrolase [Bryobacteraceae bacterium]|nr:alpha/beta hydrolase [Bryobacteraceae bacterium]
MNGLQLYYEIHGAGQPLILMHGGIGSTTMFAELLPALLTGRQVIAIDLQAHGRTADIDRPLRYESMGDDIAGLLRHLDVGQADLMGYSLGGGVALRTAIQYPAAVRKLIILSAPCKRDGWYPEVMAAASSAGPDSAEQMKPTPFYEAYARTAPRPEDWPVLHAKLGEMVRRDYDWSPEVAALHIPALLIFGDADSVRPAHIVEFFEGLGGGKRDAGWNGSGISKARLAIIPGVTHYNILSSPLLAPMVNDFLETTPVGSGNS